MMRLSNQSPWTGDAKQGNGSWSGLTRASIPFGLLKATTQFLDAAREIEGKFASQRGEQIGGNQANFAVFEVVVGNFHAELLDETKLS